jgi:hypothetical protein
MGYYLRDKMLQNVSINETNLRALSDALEAAVVAAPVVPDQLPYQHYIIRFDGQGNRAFSLGELLTFFKGAMDVERLIMTLDTLEAINTNRAHGTYIEISLDRDDQSRCFFRVSSDDQGWVNAHFAAIDSIFSKLKTGYGFVRAQPFTGVVQVLAMVVGYTLSLVAAKTIAPNLDIDNSIIFAFIFVLLVYSHLWGLLGPALNKYLNRGFPLVRFDNGKRRVTEWLFQGLVTSAVWGGICWCFLNVGVLLLPKLTGLIK